jgi:hypothetical protein
MMVNLETESAAAMASQVAPSARICLIFASCAGVQMSLSGMGSENVRTKEHNKNIRTLVQLAEGCQHI